MADVGNWAVPPRTTKEKAANITNMVFSACTTQKIYVAFFMARGSTLGNFLLKIDQKSLRALEKACNQGWGG